MKALSLRGRVLVLAVSVATLVSGPVLDLTYRNLDNSLESVEQGTGDPTALTDRLLNTVQSVPSNQNQLINAWIIYAGDDNERLVNNHERIALLQLPSQIYRGIKSDEFVVFAAEPVSLWRIWRCLGCVRLESFSRHTA